METTGAVGGTCQQVSVGEIDGTTRSNSGAVRYAYTVNRNRTHRSDRVTPCRSFVALTKAVPAGRAHLLVTRSRRPDGQYGAVARDVTRSRRVTHA